MSSIDVKELFELCEQLADTQRDEVADFARFLLAKNGDEAWEKAVADSKARPKLDAFVRSALAEGSEPMDIQNPRPLDPR